MISCDITLCDNITTEGERPVTLFLDPLFERVYDTDFCMSLKARDISFVYLNRPASNADVERAIMQNEKEIQVLVELYERSVEADSVRERHNIRAEIDAQARKVGNRIRDFLDAIALDAVRGEA